MHGMQNNFIKVQGGRGCPLLWNNSAFGIMLDFVEFSQVWFVKILEVPRIFSFLQTNMIPDVNAIKIGTYVAATEKTSAIEY